MTFSTRPLHENLRGIRAHGIHETVRQKADVNGRHFTFILMGATAEDEKGLSAAATVVAKAMRIGRKC